MHAYTKYCFSVYNACVHVECFALHKNQGVHYTRGVLDASTCTEVKPARSARYVSLLLLCIYCEFHRPAPARVGCACERRPGRLSHSCTSILVALRATSMHVHTKYCFSVYSARVHADCFALHKNQGVHYTKGVQDASTCTRLKPARSARYVSLLLLCIYCEFHRPAPPGVGCACERRPGRLSHSCTSILVALRATSMHAHTKYCFSVYSARVHADCFAPHKN
jgi:hypothetical protein